MAKTETIVDIIKTNKYMTINRPEYIRLIHEMDKKEYDFYIISKKNIEGITLLNWKEENSHIVAKHNKKENLYKVNKNFYSKLFEVDIP